MFPLRDENPHFMTPFVTWAILAANVASWVYVQGLGAPGPLVDSLCRLGMIPGEFLGRVASGTSVSMGGGAACVLGAAPTWHTPITSMFLHGGWLHLLGNLWFLWIFGNNVEDSMGHARFAVFYVLCGLVAVAAHVAAAPDSAVPMIGASGAIGGVMGAYIVLYPRVRVQTFVWLGFWFLRFTVPAFVMLAYWFVLQLMGANAALGRSGGGTAFWAHVGGFAAGGVLVPLFRNPTLVARHPLHGWRSRR